MQQKLKAPQDIKELFCVSGPFFGGFIVQKTLYTNTIITKLYLNALNNDISSLRNSNDKNCIDINFKFLSNAFHLKIYKMATPYLFKFKDPTSS